MWMLPGNLKCVILMHTHTHTQEQQQTIRLHTVDSLRLRCKHTEHTHTQIERKRNYVCRFEGSGEEIEHHPCACVSVHV